MKTSPGTLEPMSRQTRIPQTARLSTGISPLEALLSLSPF